MKKIKAITFDFWSTLYHYTQSPRAGRLVCIQSALKSVGQNGIEKSQLAKAMQSAWDDWDTVWRTEHRTLGADDWLSSVLKYTKTTLPKELFFQTSRDLADVALEDTTLPIDGVPETLAKLSQYYRLGIISDTGIASGATLRQLLVRDNLAQYFSHLVFSDEFGRSKPHPNVFLDALSHLNVESHQAAHVGDLRHTDIFGANRVGMRTVRFAGIRDDQDEQYPEADIVVKNYIELEEYFDQ